MDKDFEKFEIKAQEKDKANLLEEREFHKCTLNRYCGLKKDGYCTIDFCAFQKGRQYIKPYQLSTVQFIKHIERTRDTFLRFVEIIALLNNKCRIKDKILIDEEGYILNLKTHRIIGKTKEI